MTPEEHLNRHAIENISNNFTELSEVHEITQERGAQHLWMHWLSSPHKPSGRW
jgi:hypothetical protein